MKTWSQPIAVVQLFGVNDYISACYTVQCDGETFSYYYEDTNNNGLYELQIDNMLLDPASAPEHEHSVCHGGQHVVIIRNEVPEKNNGFAAPLEDRYKISPCFYWYGDVLDGKNAGTRNSAVLHCTDITRSDAITKSSNFS